jgi:cytochrome P450
MSGLGACLLVQVSPPPGAALREKYLKLLMYYLALRRVRIDNRVTLPPGGLLSSMAQRLNTSTRQTTRAVHEFDHLRLPIGADHTPFEFLEALRDEAVGESRPIGWSESHGGYWVVAGYTEAEQIFRDPKTFSNRVVSWPQYKMLGGRKVMLGEYDPPEHTQYRRLIQAQFSPKRADALAASVRSDIALLIDEFIGVGPRGRRRRARGQDRRPASGAALRPPARERHNIPVVDQGPRSDEDRPRRCGARSSR